MVGKECWKAAFGYDGELRLHFGASLPYESPQMAGQFKGEWRLGTCGTAWILLKPNGFVSSKHGFEHDLEKKVKVLEGSRITRLDVSVPSNTLNIAFSNRWLFQIVPSPEDDRYDLPYWQLFMPDHMVVSFGPGRHWSCRRSDVPISQ